MSGHIARHRRAVAPAFLLAVALGACGSGDGGPTVADALPRETLEPIVARDVALGPAGAVPAALVELLAPARVALLGEIHYAEEHRAFLAALVPPLHAAGYRVLADEAMHAVAWLGDAYVAGADVTLPSSLSLFDRDLLAALRAFNAGVEPADRFRFVGFDMNQWHGVFQAGIGAFQALYGHLAVLDAIQATASDSASYDRALAALPARLAAQRATLVSAIGAERMDQLVELVDVEARSRPLRARSVGAAREDLIRERLTTELARAGTAGVMITCGWYHAQMETHTSLGYPSVGTWLATHPDAYGGDRGALVAVLFGAARGTRLWHFNDTTSWTFDLEQDDPPSSLTRILAESAGSELAYLPLTDPLLSAHYVVTDLGRDLQISPVGLQFDALVLYPTVSLLRSLMEP